MAYNWGATLMGRETTALFFRLLLNGVSSKHPLSIMKWRADPSLSLSLSLSLSPPSAGFEAATEGQRRQERKFHESVSLEQISVFFGSEEEGGLFIPEFSDVRSSQTKSIVGTLIAQLQTLCL